MELSIEKLFGPGGPLARADPDYENRPQQSRMAGATAECFDSGRPLVVEAGTGVGKSLAYLLPSALWAASGDRRVLISTHTRTLQEQLMERELPLVSRVSESLGFPLRFAMLMGSNNYLCAQRLTRFRSAPPLIEEASDGAPWAQVERLARWAETAKTGHRSAVPWLVPQSLWGRVSRDPDICLGSSGPYWSSCLYRKDREKAESAHILVVNHALLLSAARLPSFDALVIDEAHHLEDAAVGRFGLSVSQSRYLRLLGEIGSPDGRHGFLRRIPGNPPPMNDVKQILSECWMGATDFFGDVARSHGLAGERSQDEYASRTLLKDETYKGYEPLARLESALGSLEGLCPTAEDATELKTLQIHVDDLKKDIETILKADREDYAYWVQRQHGRLELCATPLEVGPKIYDTVFARGVPAVLTSATLSSGHGLGAFKRRLGLEDADELVLDSPFDYERQAALLVLDDLPPPKEETAFLAAVADRCEEVIGAVPGGIFILFSSWKALRRVHEMLKVRVKGRPVWTQGSSGNESLIEDFLKAGNAVLLGVDTFWHGVDVQGSALSCVVMVKLPFPQFGSPVEDSRRGYFESLGLNYFDSHSLPKAVMKFRQGFGRLIRSSADRGAVVVMDPRAVRSSYGTAFLESIPACRRLESIEELSDFFTKG